MRELSGIMGKASKDEYLESCRVRYAGRNRAGKSLMIDELSDTFGWDRKHTIKALNGKVSLGKGAGKRGKSKIYGEAEKAVIVEIWKRSEQPCGARLKETLPLWMVSYEKHWGRLPTKVRTKVLQCSARQLDRITEPHRMSDPVGRGRRTGRLSHRLKQSVPMRCGPWDVDAPGWMEADTVSHGGGSSSGLFLWTLTLTDIHTGWTELAPLWGNSGGEVCLALVGIEARMPFIMEGFDCDNGSEFLNEALEKYLLERHRRVAWTRSRAYKKNDQAHVEQKNFTHVRQLIGYGRFAEHGFKELVADLYETAWLPLRNYFTPTMKLVEKRRVNGKYHKKYDTPQPPCDRLLACSHVSAATKRRLKKERAALDPIELSRLLEEKLSILFAEVDRIEAEQEQERCLEAEVLGEIAARRASRGGANAGADSVAARSSSSGRNCAAARLTRPSTSVTTNGCRLAYPRVCRIFPRRDGRDEPLPEAHDAAICPEVAEDRSQ
jgi:hypothetical protein